MHDVFDIDKILCCSGRINRWKTRSTFRGNPFITRTIDSTGANGSGEKRFGKRGKGSVVGSEDVLFRL